MNVRATIRIETEHEVTVYVDAESSDDVGEREVLNAVYSSGEYLEAIDVDVRSWEVIA